MNDVIHAYLDGTLPPEREAELNAWIKADAGNAARFAEAAALHDRLGDLVRTRRQPLPEASPRAIQRERRWSFRVGLATLAAAALIAGWWIVPAPLNAATELEKLIEGSSGLRDRSYVIHNLDPQPEQAEERRPPIDGAILHVRHPDQYVLVRKFPDGRLFTTGSDGEHSWSVPPDGAVRVSSDPLRFRGPLPGNQHGIPFVDLRSDLLKLRDAYDITLLQPDAQGRRGLKAEKKSADHRGPARVELWYDHRTGVIHRMVFDGMPRARGGPSRVGVELSGERELGSDFFRHGSHHGAGRKVIEEE